jgi:hypothetical protein
MLSAVMGTTGSSGLMGQAAFSRPSMRHAPGTQTRDQTRQAGRLSGIRGCGKTTIPRRVRESIEREKEILVSRRCRSKKARSIWAAIVALFADLATDKCQNPDPNVGNAPSAIS